MTRQVTLKRGELTNRERPDSNGLKPESPWWNDGGKESTAQTVRAPRVVPELARKATTSIGVTLKREKQKLFVETLLSGGAAESCGIIHVR